MFATHGHYFNKENMPPLKTGDILLHGHTHVQALEDNGEYYYINPGSVSIPKNGNEHSYMVYEDHKFVLKNLDGTEIGCLELG